MRKAIYAVSLAFVLGGLAPMAQAGEGCSYSGKTVKKNDVEAPPPAAATSETKKQG